MGVIRIRHDDMAYLLSVLDVGPDLYRRLQVKQEQLADDPRQLVLDDEEADQLRELCMDRLQVVGFDEDYHLTTEGKRLEDLIDKLFTG